MFEGKEFCVINGPKGLSKEDMERKIAEVCGSCTYIHTYIFVMKVLFVFLSLAWRDFCPEPGARHLLCAGAQTDCES